VYKKTAVKLSLYAKAVLIFVLFIASFGLNLRSIEREAAEEKAVEAEEQARKVARDRQENIDYFSVRKDEIISSALLAISEKNYQLAVSQTSKYLPANDLDLNKVHHQAKSALQEKIKAENSAKVRLKREEKTKDIVDRLKSVPANELKENKDLYAQLVQLNPDNEKYKQKSDYYSRKLIEDEERKRVEQEKENRERQKIEKEHEDRITRFGEPPKKSAWDGSYYAVGQYLKIVANDPDSIEVDGCTSVYHTKDGWLVGCTYRGRNAFGGMIRKSSWFTIIHDQVIQMHEASTYRP